MSKPSSTAANAELTEEIDNRAAAIADADLLPGPLLSIKPLGHWRQRILLRQRGLNVV